ncbi:MAG: hypothetical protein HYV63_17840 [Candidatus Schekmanbacteria bacterium]|nr:hypothetical protein [Candidatus Schekmanbacteria bacterium]
MIPSRLRFPIAAALLCLGLLASTGSSRASDSRLPLGVVPTFMLDPSTWTPEAIDGAVAERESAAPGAGTGGPLILIRARLSPSGELVAGESLCALAAAVARHGGKAALALELPAGAQGADPYLAIERTLVACGAQLSAVAVALSSATHADNADELDRLVYAVRRCSVLARGLLGSAAAVLVGPLDAAERGIGKALYERGIDPYADGILIAGETVEPGSQVGATEVEAMRSDVAAAESGDAVVVMRPWPATPDGEAWDGLLRLTAEYVTSGVSGVIDNPSPAAVAAAFRLARVLPGTVARDVGLDVRVATPGPAAAAGSRRLLLAALVDSRDLATWVVGVLPAQSRIELGSSWYDRAGVVFDQTGDELPVSLQVGDGVTKVSAPSTSGGIVLRAPRPGIDAEGMLRVSEEVTSTRELGVEEIIVRHQAVRAAEEARVSAWTVRSRTAMRLRAPQAGQLVELTIDGSLLHRRGQGIEWVWETFFINGVRWPGETAPELPILEPDKMAKAPLELRLGRDYSYRLLGHDSWKSYPCYVVSFRPDPNARLDAQKELVSGVAWIHRDTFARVYVQTLRSDLGSEVVATEERTEYEPISPKDGKATLPTDPGAVWLASRFLADETLSVSGRTVFLERETTASAYAVNPVDFTARRQALHATKHRILKQTADGLRYLAPATGTSSGERTMLEAPRRSRWAAIGGVFVDDAADAPLPLGGVSYSNLDFKGTGSHVNLFFAGVLSTVTIARPNLGLWDLDGHVDGFALLYPIADTPYERGEPITAETVTTRVGTLAFGVGRQLGVFSRLRLSYEYTYRSYGRHADTADAFVEPADTGVHGGELELSFNRHGYGLTATYALSYRDRWRRWGYPESAEYDPAQRRYQHWGLHLFKAFSFSGYQRLQFSAAAAGGRDLDRFSRYQVGLFGGNAVHGFKSASLRGDDLYSVHASYGVSLREVVRLEALYDRAWIRDRTDSTGFRAIHGVGLAGECVLPWQIMTRFDIGVPIDPPSGLDGFVASVVLLRFF